MATDGLNGASASRAGEPAEFARSLPAGHEILVELHELRGHRDRFLLVAQLEDGIAADHLLGFDERTVDDAELPVPDAHLRTGSQRQQPAIVEHATGLELA